jgi:hypothetical protein
MIIDVNNPILHDPSRYSHVKKLFAGMNIVDTDTKTWLAKICGS